MPFNCRNFFYLQYGFLWIIILDFSFLCKMNGSTAIFSWQTHFAEVIHLLTKWTLLAISWAIGGLWMPFGLPQNLHFHVFFEPLVDLFGRSWFLGLVLLLSWTRWSSSFDCLLSCWSDLIWLFVISPNLHMSRALSKDKSFSRSNLAFVPVSWMPMTSLSRIISSISVPNWQEDASFLNLLT